ncbi:AAA family ATPase [bacterium]|nr:AAA family ATPase [bacterium]MBU1958876.1 AAA family ATPase [bacterium]
MKKKQENYNQFSIELETALKEHLFDQEDAVEAIVKTLVQSYMLESKSKVQALFTFIGAPNSGKHYACELLEKLNPKITHLKTFYMEQYSGGINDEQPFMMEVIEFVQNNPSAVLVFEDIEKADLQIQLALYTLFTDYEKNEVDFSRSVVIVTTTLLSALLQRKDVQKLLKSDPLQAHTFLIEHLAKEQVIVEESMDMAFDKKLLSLLNEHTLVTFNRLSLKALIKIGARSLHQMSQAFSKKNDVAIEYREFDAFISLLTLSLAPYLNARHIKQKIPKLMFNHIYDLLKSHEHVEKIQYEVSEKAKQFLKKLLEDEQLFLKKITRQHKHISLKWDIVVHENEVQCSIKSLFYTQEKLSISSHEDMHISDIQFKDIAGHIKVKEELTEIVTLLKEPKRLKKFDLAVPKGMILYGPEGMGKKLLAKAFASEANMPYVVVNGSDLFTAKNIHQAYAQAYRSAPAIVILEDIDIQGIVGGVISTMSVEPIIEELDALHQSFDAPIFTIITLSSSAEIPETLLEVNRINIHIEVPKLDMEARTFFIKEILKKPHDKTIDVQRIVRYISGMGGNELKRIGQEASLFAARKGLKMLTEEILLEQINIIKYGTKLENKHIRDIEISMSKTAYHEAGHAVLSYLLLPKIKIEQVTVAPRSEALGFVSYHNDDYIDATSKEDLFNDICVLLAGRIAKMHKYGEDGMETGAMSDLEVATTQAYAAIALFGMDEELGYINISGLDVGGMNPILNHKIEERILVWIERATQKTEKEVKRLWKAIDAVALELIQKEMIDGEALKSIIENNIPSIK